MSWHQTIIVGNLGADPEGRQVGNDNQVCNFRVAVSNKWTDKSGERREETTWYTVESWGKLANTCQEYLNKGSQVMVIGQMRTPEGYMDREGNPAAQLRLRAREVRFMGSRNSNGGGSGLSPADFGSGNGQGSGTSNWKEYPVPAERSSTPSQGVAKVTSRGRANVNVEEMDDIPF